MMLDEMIRALAEAILKIENAVKHSNPGANKEMLDQARALAEKVIDEHNKAYKPKS